MLRLAGLRTVSARARTLRAALLLRRYSDVPTAEFPPETISIVPTVSLLTDDAGLFKNEYAGSLITHLQSRNLIESLTSDNLFELTEEGQPKLNVYCGADPTAKSLHLGNLLPLMVALHFALRGHGVVGLVGGATGAIGDPSGRTTERSQMEQIERENNVTRIRGQIEGFFKNGFEYAKSRNVPGASDTALLQQNVKSVNNADWWQSVKFLDFLASFGLLIRVSQMLARDSILSRLDSQQGIGYNEFSYQILQAYDFWHLMKEHSVNVQVGGNDQWGNITAGIDLISRAQKKYGGLGNKKSELPAFGVTVPLLTTPKGEKFGKSAGNAVFISKTMTSPYQLYQFFINTEDEMVAKLLKMFTLLPLESIDGHILPKHEDDPGLRIAQRVLAREVVDLVHGPGVGDEMAYITSFLFPTPDQPFDDDLTADKLILKFKNSGILQQVSLSSFKNPDDLKLSTLLATILGKSKSETKNTVRAGGVYLGLNRDQLLDQDDVVLFDKENHLVDGKLLLVRVGKQNYSVVEITE